jgi:hypothetical protein
MAHGGGKRCQEEDCTKSARGGTHAQRCSAHGGANNARRRAVPRQLLVAARSTVSRMAGAGGARRMAAPNQLKAVRFTAPRTEVAGGASTRAAPSQSLKLPLSTALHAVSAVHTAVARRCGGAVALSTRPATQLARTRGDPGQVEDFARLGLLYVSASIHNHGPPHTACSGTGFAYRSLFSWAISQPSRAHRLLASSSAECTPAGRSEAS